MAETVATTTAGKVRGAERQGVVTFRGIPFAAPPVGPRRFLAPAPPAPWEGERECTAYGPICPQLYLRVEGPMAALGVEEPQDEDCLFLNVWTPAVDDARRPVMVWIHGGAFTSGSGSIPLYDGTNLAERGVVVVSINYRLNVFGFLHLADLFDGVDGSGNCGILDQVAALAWVRDNIAAFGGDPGNVTIFGESAGGMSVGTLLGTRAASGLFRRAIAQSGAASHNLPASTATRVARFVIEHAGVKPGDLAALQAVPASRLVELATMLSYLPTAQRNELLGDDSPKKMALMPVVDGVVRDRIALEDVAAGAAKGVDVLVGTNAEEWRLFYYGVPEGMRGMVPAADVGRYFSGSGRSPEEVTKTYQEEQPSAIDRDIDCAIETDLMFAMPAIRLVEEQAAHNPNTRRYLFTWRTPAAGGALGACHALDIPFVFANLGYPEFVGETPPTALSEAMQEAWVRFAAGGDPNHPGLPAWPVWDHQRRAVMNLGETCRVVDDPDAARRGLWHGVV